MKASIERSVAKQRHPRDVAQGLMLADPDPRFPRDAGVYLMGHKDGVLVFAKAVSPEQAKELAKQFVNENGAASE